MSYYASFQGRVYLGERNANGEPINVRSPGNVADLSKPIRKTGPEAVSPRITGGDKPGASKGTFGFQSLGEYVKAARAFKSSGKLDERIENAVTTYGRESVREFQKVVWPTRKEAGQMTGYVFAFVVVMALFLWFTDKTLEWVLYDLILGWKR